MDNNCVSRGIYKLGMRMLQCLLNETYIIKNCAVYFEKEMSKFMLIYATIKNFHILLCLLNLIYVLLI